MSAPPMVDDVLWTNCWELDSRCSWSDLKSWSRLALRGFLTHCTGVSSKKTSGAGDGDDAMTLPPYGCRRQHQFLALRQRVAYYYEGR